MSRRVYRKKAMTHEDAVRHLKGRVRALLTEVRNRNAGKQTFQLYTNSRLFRELQEALNLVDSPQEYRDALMLSGDERKDGQA